MKRIPDAVHDIVSSHTFLQYGMSYRLLNLTLVAKHIRPMVETRCQKDVQVTAIVTALSRLQKHTSTNAPMQATYTVDNVSVKSGLATRTLLNTPETRAAVHKLAEDTHAKNQFFQYTETTHEITLFHERSAKKEVEKHLKFSPKYTNDNIACVGVRFSEELFHTPGLLHVLMQRISMQDINIVDIASTFTAFNFFIRDEDVKTVFETLHDNFL